MTVVPSKDDPLLTTKQVGEILGVKQETVRDWCRKGKLPNIILPGGDRRILKSDMVKLVNQKYGDK